MDKTMLITDTGAAICLSDINAVFPHYIDGQDTLKVVAVVNGIDIVVKMIPVSKDNGGIDAAKEAASEYMAKIISIAGFTIETL